MSQDPRRRYTHQAYDVTTYGKPLETGPTGYGKRLSGTYQSTMLLPAIAMDGDANQLVGDMTSGSYVIGIINHTPLTSGTLQLTLDDVGNGVTQVTTQAVDLTTVSVIFTGINPDVVAPLTEDRPLIVSIASGTPGEQAAVSLMVGIAESNWF